VTHARTGIYDKGTSAWRETLSRAVPRHWHAVLLLLCPLLALGTEIHAAPLAHGDLIVNTVTVTALDNPVFKASATVLAIIPTPATIEFMQYAPGVPAAQQLPVAPGAYRGGTVTSPFVALPPPRSLGFSAPIDLSQPVPLLPATQIHQGDPLFIRVIDLDQNLDRTLRETIQVTVTNPATGDTEVIRLTETGPATGVFVGYLPTTPAASTPFNGLLQVGQANRLTAIYVDPDDASDTAASAIMVDPFGVVFDSSSGLPVNGASITMIDTASGLPATIFGDDGVSSFPSTLISGGSASDSSGRAYAFPAGAYRFPFVQPGSYQYRVTPPAGYAAPSSVPTTTIQALPGGPFTIAGGSRGGVFVINPGPALRIDIPLDPSASLLWMQKSAGKDSAGHGDFIPYQLTVTNGSMSTPAFGVRVTDTLPIGLRLRSGSVRVNTAVAGDPTVSADGRSLTFDVGTLKGGVAAVIDYVVEVTAGARLGGAVNSAIASSTAGGRSNTARATVTIKDDFLRTRSTLMGRVTSGACGAASEEAADGVEGVRVYLEDGSFVVSDRRGLFHFEGVRAGLHVVQLDLDSLPEGYEANPCTQNSRFAGRAFSQFVETQGGTLWRTDFHVRSKIKPVPEKPLPSPPAPLPPQEKGEIVLEFASSVEGQGIVYRATMRVNDLPVRGARLNIILPEGVEYEADSSLGDGVAISDPLIDDRTRLIYALGDLPVGAHKEIAFSARPTRGRKAGALMAQAYITADNASNPRVLTPPAETTLQLDKDKVLFQMPEVVLRPHFPTFGAELSPADRERLDELARLLAGLNAEKIHVIGHTDNVPIAHRTRGLFPDNQALSRARARSVGRYLMEKLHVPPEKLSLEGKGGSMPIADNRTEDGRALNRRVEVRITSSRIVPRPQLRVIKALSGEQRAVTGTRVPIAGPAVDASQSKAAAVVKAAPADAAPSAPTDEALGFIGRREGDLLVNRINAVQFKLESGLTAKLLVDGREVPSKQLGYRRQDPASGTTQYGYIGVDFGDAGEHTLTMQGLDPFGNVRFDRVVRLVRTGDVAAIRLQSAEGNVADGTTPVRMRLQLFDGAGNLIRAATELELRDGNLKAPVPDSQSLEEKAASRRLMMDRDGWVSFQPVTSSGSYRVLLAYNSAVVEAETYVQPKLRDWILVGLAEGTLGYNTASGNMESLQGTAMAEDLYKDGRIALFAKGQIQGKWLLTMAYDTAKTKGNSPDGLFQTINPDTYFTLYGDAGQQQYDAASTKKLYIRIEREQFYAMFGDYDTGLTVTELTRYSRRMTGLKTELQGRNYEVNAFASETEQSFQRDELPGDGTSGVYRLSRGNVVPNSEKITIETRDRFRSEILVSSRTLGRFTDYSIDYETGAVIFKEPIHNRDPQFNPITIVAEYEVVAGGGQDYTYGGRAGLKLLDQRLKVGSTYIHEGQGGRTANLYGGDASLLLGPSTKLRAEFATSDFAAGGASRSGTAYLAEAAHTSKSFDAKAYIREQESGFGLGQQPGSEAGTRKLGVEGAYRFNDRISGSGNIYRQYNLLTNATRDVGEGKLNYTDKRYGASVGLLQADDHLADGSNHRSTQLTLGGKLLTLYDRLTLTLDHAQSIGSNGNSDFPTRTSLGADFMVTKSLSLLAAQELTWGTGAVTQNTRLGMRSTPWQGAALTSSVERRFNENDERVFANVGLRQTWQVSDAWKVDAGLDRSHTLARAAHYSFNTNVPPASGGSENFTAVSGGATYQVKHLTWDNRLEYRTAGSENKWGLMSGLVNEVDSSWAWSGRAQLFQTSASGGVDTTRASLRYGLVFRPPQTRWIVLNRLDYQFDKQSGGSTAGLDTWRLVNNLIANYRPRKELQVSLQYGAKYVRDTINARSYGGFTDHIGFEARYDITKKWDVGLRGSLLHSWHGGQYDYSCGPSTGYNIFENAWVSLGYNVWGFEDRDFVGAAYTAQGPYVRFRMKFDQQTVKDAAAWLNKQ
jgi:uncharacterized repeat protein (TIGR01451 family)